MSDALAIRSSTPTEATRQDRPSEEVSNGETTGDEATRSETSDVMNTNVEDVDVDLGEGMSNAASDELSGWDPTPSTNEPKPKPAFVKIAGLKEEDMLTAYLEAFFDHFCFYKKSGGDLHGNISVDTIIYLEEPKKGGLLHLDPPIRMSGGFDPCPRQRWIPELEYDENGEVILGDSKKHEKGLIVTTDELIHEHEAVWGTEVKIV